ncbi:hypothetical protein [Fibrobacter sp.]|uniref:hypothetical protein n=1 Tax=Fibrobacter sp. TaxID=35828 RepID=UPI0038666515
MSDPNNVDMLNKYLRRIYTVLADSFNVDVHKLNLSEVSHFATDYLRKDTMPSTCALDYYNKYLAKSTEDLRYSNDEKYDKFLHEVADCLEAEYHIDKRKLAEFTSFPQTCWKYYDERPDAHWTAIEFYNSCSGDEIEYMLLKLLEYSHDDGYNRFLNKVADLLERKCSIDKTKLPIGDFCRSCLPKYKNSESVLDVFKFYKTRLEGEPEDVQALRKLKPKKTEEKMATTRRNGRFSKEEATTEPTFINFDESDEYNQYLNNVLDELVKYASIDKQAFAKESDKIEYFIDYCRNWWYQDKDAIDCAQDFYSSLSKGQRDKLPKLNTQTTDEKETKTMATDNQNANAQNVPTAAPIKKIDAIGMMKVKMAESMFKKDGEIDYSKLMMMDAIGDDGKVNLNKVIEAKMNGKIMKAIESGEDIPLDKLMIFQAMQGGQIDYNQIYMYKIIGQMLDDDDKKADGKKAETK